MLRACWSALGPYKKSSAFLLVLIVACSLAETFSIGMIMPLLELILNPAKEATGLSSYILSVLAYFDISPQLMPIAAATFAVFLLKNALIILRSYVSHRYLGKLREYWSCRIIENYMFSSYKEIIAHRKGTLLNNVTNEPVYAAKCLRDTIEIVAKSMLCLLIVAMLLVVSWKVTAVGFGFGFVLTALQWRSTQKYSYSIGKKRIEMNQRLNSLVSESLAGIRQVKIFTMEARIVRFFREQIQVLVNLSVKIGVVADLPKTLGEILIIGFLMAGLVYYSVITEGNIQSLIPVAAIFLVSLQRLFVSISGLLSERIAVISFLPSLLLMRDILERRFARDEVSSGKKIDRIEGDIRFENVVFRYAEKQPLFEGISLTVKKNEINALTGPSGSGKSTLCDLLVGFFHPAAGRIFVGEDDLRALDIHAWRKRIGYVSQESFLFNMSIRDNILGGFAGVTEDEIRKAAADAGAHDFIESLPNGYETVTGESGTLLSGGQMQRIAIARALVRNPDILVFDEATSALDAKNEEAILQLVQGLKHQKTILLITHRLSALHVADVIYVLDGGRIVESGSYRQLVLDGGLFSRLKQAGQDLGPREA
jgi:ABC-type multidrug transport system fused ATPase/permease subunit